jgi:hypothetical protein
MALAGNTPVVHVHLQQCAPLADINPARHPHMPGQMQGTNVLGT